MRIIRLARSTSKIGWRLGLQAVTGVVFLTFILGTFYRSASLYHPQRRAILHLKNQKRKIKDKNKPDDRPPFFDFSTLRSKTVRILLVSTGISAFGINTPIFYLVMMRKKQTNKQTSYSDKMLFSIWIPAESGVALMLSLVCRHIRSKRKVSAIRSFCCRLTLDWLGPSAAWHSVFWSFIAASSAG